MNIKDIIPIGSENAISRAFLLTLCKEHGIADSDRMMRRAIEEARANTVILNNSDGNGYYIPEKSDVSKLRNYVSQERARYKTIIHNLRMANALLEDYEKERV